MLGFSSWLIQAQIQPLYRNNLTAHTKVPSSNHQELSTKKRDLSYLRNCHVCHTWDQTTVKTKCEGNTSNSEENTSTRYSLSSFTSTQWDAYTIIYQTHKYIDSPKEVHWNKQGTEIDTLEAPIPDLEGMCLRPNPIITIFGCAQLTIS